MFRDHTLGVQALSYLRGTLLSAGFDWEIIAWDADRLEKIGSMNGHKAPVTAVAQVQRREREITTDEADRKTETDT